MSEEKKTFQVGDLATWTSQAGGHAKTKIGKIVWIVPSGCLAGSHQLVEQGFSTHRCMGGERDHESYLIQIGKSKRLYWPLVKYLKKYLKPTGLSPLEAYKQETEPWNCELPQADPRMPNANCLQEPQDEK